MHIVHSSKTVKLDHLCIRLVTLIIHMKDRDIRVKLNKVTKFVNLTKSSLWLTLYIRTLIHKKSKAKMYQEKCKK